MRCALIRPAADERQLHAAKKQLAPQEAAPKWRWRELNPRPAVPDTGIYRFSLSLWFSGRARRKDQPSRPKVGKVSREATDPTPKQALSSVRRSRHSRRHAGRPGYRLRGGQGIVCFVGSYKFCHF